MAKRKKLELGDLKVQSFCTSFEKSKVNKLGGARTDQFWCTLGWCPTEDDGPLCTGWSCDICPA